MSVPERKGPANPIKVGLVDDDAGMLLALSELIEQDPSLVLVGTAGDAESAQRLAIEAHPDIMLMDVRMPGTGQRATSEILFRQPDIKILAHSVERDRSVVMEMLGAGVVGYVSKGSTGVELLKAIHDAAAGRGVASADISSDLIDELAGRMRHQQVADRHHRELSELIRKVLDDPSRLTVAHQPFVDLDSGEIVGFEALARFDGPPFRAPNEWFQDAWEVGLGSDLELLAIQRALETLPRVGGGKFLALNVSPAVALDPRLGLVLGSGSLSHFVLEVTEHAPVDDYTTLSKALRPLRERGIRLAIDDAGVGYAGLRHILRLSPKLIKLDAELTRGIEADRARIALAAAMIAFASEIGAEIVAEGIETEGELSSLRGLGVRWGQGYYLGRPALVSMEEPV